MAVEFQKGLNYTRTSEYVFDPKDIIIKAELNGRTEPPDVEPLIQDILAQGQLQPVLIRSDGGTPVLVAGFSRWRSITTINKRHKEGVPGYPSELKIRCCYFKGNEQDAFLANIQENRLRNATTPLDDANNMVRLERYGFTLQRIAEIYAADTAFVKRRMNLAKLTPEAKTALKEGRMKETAAQAIAKLTSEQQREVIARSNGHVKGVTIREVAEQGKPKPEAKPRMIDVLRDIETNNIFPAWYRGGQSEQDTIAAFVAELLEHSK